MDRSLLEDLIRQDMSIREICSATGKGYSTVRRWLSHYKLKTNQKYNNWDISKLRLAIESSKSRREVLRVMGFRDTGSNYVTLAKVCERNSILIPEYPDARKIRNPLKPSEEIFKKGTYYKGSTLRRHMVQVFKIKEECLRCGLTEWLDEPIRLEVDHADGDNTNNEITNLRFLCPNCHSQAETSHRNKSKSR